MQVEVRFFATLRQFSPAGTAGVAYIDMPEGATIAALLRQIGVNSADVHMIMVNGIQASRDRVLVSADRVGLFPPVGGG